LLLRFSAFKDTSASKAPATAVGWLPLGSSVSERGFLPPGSAAKRRLEQFVAVPLHEGVAKRTAVCVGCPNQLTTQSVSLDALTCKLHEQTPTAPEPAQQRDA
jgi:hypothetical protein